MKQEILFDECHHQVAGHGCTLLLNYQRKIILKRARKKALLDREKCFYDALRRSVAKKFISKYFGTISVFFPFENTDYTYIALEDVTNGFEIPNVMDIKMGTQTFEPNASPEKKKEELMKYVYQSVVGFRITGFRSFDLNIGDYKIAGKEFGRSLFPDLVDLGIALFFFDGISIRDDIIAAVIIKLDEILNWMQVQTQYNFFASSLLIVYDAVLNEQTLPIKCSPDKVSSRSKQSYNCVIDSDSATLNEIEQHVLIDSVAIPKAIVKMIDFAHVVESETTFIDHEYVYGLKNLIKKLQYVVTNVGDSHFRQEMLKLQSLLI